MGADVDALGPTALLGLALGRFAEDRRREQLLTFRTDLEALTGPERGRKWMEWLLALQVEVGELSGTVGWKPWVSEDAQGRINSAEFAEEMADVLIFLGNLVALSGVSGAQLALEVERKTLVNRERQLAGYRGAT